MLRVAVLGLGKMGQRHLEKWSQISNCEIVGVVGRDLDKLTKLGSTYNTQAFSNLEYLLKGAEVDVIDVCLPTYLHFPYVKQAAEARKHVICEKPLGMNRGESKAIIEICRQQNVQLYIGQTLRFSSEYVDAHRQVKKGVIGKPGVLRLSRGTPFPNGKDSWYADTDKSGGIILDLGIHDFDWLIWTFGDVERVMAKHVKRKLNAGNNLEYALVTLKMIEGAIVHLELSWNKTVLETSFELAGEKGMLINNSKDSTPIMMTSPDTFNEPTYLSNNMLGDSPVLQQLRHFKDCIVEGTRPIVTANEALKAVEVAEAAIQSASTGHPVQLMERGSLR